MHVLSLEPEICSLGVLRVGMNLNAPHRSHVNGDSLNGHRDPHIDDLSNGDESTTTRITDAREEVPETEPEITPPLDPAEDRESFGLLPATRHITPTKYRYATPLADAPQLDRDFIDAETHAETEKGETRVAEQHRNLHIMARGGEMRTLERKRESVAANLNRVVQGIERLSIQMKRTRQWMDTPSAEPPKAWTWWEVLGAGVLGIAALACLFADVHTYWVNLMESGIRTFVENPISAGLYGALALVLPFGLKFVLGRFSRKDSGPCPLARTIVGLTIVCALAAFVAFAMSFRAPGEESAASFGSLASDSVEAQSAVPQRVFTVLLMITTGMLSAVLGHWLTLVLEEHRRGGRVLNPQYAVVRDELERLQLIENYERETLGAIEGKLAELQAEQSALVDSATNLFRELRGIAQRDSARLARLAQGTSGAAALRGARVRKGVGKLAALIVAGTLALGITGCGHPQARQPVTSPDQVRQLVFAVSPALPREMRESLYSAAGEWVLSAAPGDRFSVFDALNLKSICEVAIPNEAFYTNNRRAREREFGPQLAALRAFFQHEPQADALGRIMLPQFFSMLAQQRRGERLSVIVVGSALYANPADPACDMTDGCFPSDGHLSAEPTLSPFSLKGHESSLTGATVHYVYAPDDFVATGTPHLAGVQRFLALYTQGFGGILSSFSPDLRGVLRAAHDGGSRPVVEATVNAADGKPEMHRVIIRRMDQVQSVASEAETREATLQERMLGELSAEEHHQPAPPSSRVEHFSAGAKWNGRWDIDFYISGDGRAPELFFGRTRSAPGGPTGIFYKDHRDAPPGINGFETIEFTSPVDLATATAWLNFYEGNAPKGADVSVRVIVNGKRYERGYKISANAGNRGGNAAGRANDSHWVRVNLAEVCGIPVNRP